MWSERLASLMAKAIADGATPIGGLPNAWFWEVSGSCKTPVAREIHARDVDRKPNRQRMVSPSWTGTLVMRVPCRKCEGCLRYKAWLWRQRAAAELKLAPRTWMGTLTFSAEEHYLARVRIAHALAHRSVSLDMLTELDLFKERARDMGAVCTKYFKRLRKGGADIRYLLVTEAHKSGLPHLHLLLHEVDFSNPVRKRVLQGQWPWFSGFKLVDDTDDAAFYVTKYVAKSMLGRVRASQHYGYLDRPTGLTGIKLTSVITSHLLEGGNLSDLELHRFF